MRSDQIVWGESSTYVSSRYQIGVDLLLLGKLGPQSPYREYLTAGSSGWCWWCHLTPAPAHTQNRIITQWYLYMHIIIFQIWYRSCKQHILFRPYLVTFKTYEYMPILFWFEEHSLDMYTVHSEKVSQLVVSRCFTSQNELRCLCLSRKQWRSQVYCS